MNKGFLLGILSVVLITSLVLGATDLPVIVEEVEINGVTLEENSVNRLSIERGDELNVRVKLFAYNDSKNVQVRAFIDGYEYSYAENMDTETPVFDVEKGVYYIKKLKLKLPENMDKDNYALKIVVSNRNGYLNTYYYSLLIDTPRHYLKIRDVVLNPENVVKAGSYIVALVRVKNMGAKDEEGVKVKVSIPQLGVVGSDYIDEIKSGDSETSEEIALRIPECTKQGTYDVVTEVIYDEGYRKDTYNKKITIIESDACEILEEKEEEKVEISITVPSETVKIKSNEEAMYPIAIVNNGKTTKTFVLKVEGLEDWASSKLTSNVIVLKGKESKIVYLKVSPTEKAEGSKVFWLVVEAEGKVLQKIPLSIEVEKEKVTVTKYDKLKLALEIGIVVLVIILVILGLLIGLSKSKKKGEEEKTYY